MQYNILIVEDEKEIADAIEIYLKTQNYNVFKAYHGTEGLDVIQNNEIHLAIVDIMMPVMDGITMVKKVRENYDFSDSFPVCKIGRSGYHSWFEYWCR